MTIVPKIHIQYNFSKLIPKRNHQRQPFSDPLCGESTDIRLVSLTRKARNTAFHAITSPGVENSERTKTTRNQTTQFTSSYFHTFQDINLSNPEILTKIEAMSIWLSIKHRINSVAILQETEAENVYLLIIDVTEIWSMKI